MKPIPLHRPSTFLALRVGLALLAWPLTASGSTGLAFLKVGAGAHAVAMGDAVTSNVNDASAVYWNPGALPLMTRSNAELMHNESFQSVRYEFASITRDFGRHAAGIAFNGVWTDQLRAYDDRGEFQGKFGYYGLAASGSYGYGLSDRVGVGVGAEYLREAVDVFSTSGLAFNFGLQAREVLPRTSMGLAVLHLGASMKYEEEEFQLPATFQGGLSHRIPLDALDGSLLVSVEGRKTRGENASFLLGTEYNFQDLARLQIGYRTGLDTQNVSLGVGVGRGRILGQYAFVPFRENLGDQHRFSVLIDW